jgi:SAM-dependent methyltransferase
MASDANTGGIREWWAENPMTYGSVHGHAAYEDGQYTLGTPEFFERVDREFFSWNAPLHDHRPFGRLFPFGSYGQGSRVLEIGCGMGTMAMLWALNGADVTAVDLNPTAVEQTTRRFEIKGLAADIHLEDANRLALPDAHFDYAYSWGVLHHSPNLEQSLSEMMRVLKPGGGFGIMLYNRRSLWHWYLTEYVEGFLHYEKRFLDPLQLASRYGDGYREEGNPHTWPVTRKEMRQALREHCGELKFKILGTELDSVFRTMLPGVGLALPRIVKKSWARRFGWSLWMYGHKKG